MRMRDEGERRKQAVRERVERDGGGRVTGEDEGTGERARHVRGQKRVEERRGRAGDHHTTSYYFTIMCYFINL